MYNHSFMKESGPFGSLIANVSGTSTNDGLTFPAITEDAQRYMPDHEGIYRALKAQELPVHGHRRVENLVSFSEDMTQAGYGVLNNATVDSATQATFDGTADGNVRFDETITDNGAGRTFIFSVKVRLVSGSISSDAALQLLVRGNAVTQASANIGNLVTTTAQRFTLTATTDASGTVVSPEVRWDDAGTLEVTEWMLEESTGRADTTTPSENVSTGVVSDHGWNVDGVKNFRTENGNTVNSNVVTEGVGALIVAGEGDNVYSPAGYTGEGEATNLILWCRDFTNAAWTATNITPLKDAVGVDGIPNSASTLTATDANGTILQSVTLTSSDHVATFFVKRKTGTGTIEITIDGGSTWEDITSGLSTTQYLQFRVEDTLANPEIGFRIVTDTDEIEVDFAGLWDTTYSLTPLLTTTASDSRPATTGATSPLPLFSNAQGAFECKLTPWFDTAPASSEGIVTPNSVLASRFLSFNSAADTRIALNDGTSVAVLEAFNYGEQITIKVRWGNGTMQFSVIRADGTVLLSSEVAYDDSFSPSGAITYFKSLTLAASIMDIKYFSQDIGSNWLSAG